jgi:hypothetical protein
MPPSPEARLIGEHRNSREMTYADRQRGPRIPTGSDNPREENRTADRSGYLIGGCASRVVGDEPDPCRVSVGFALSARQGVSFDSPH